MPERGGVCCFGVMAIIFFSDGGTGDTLSARVSLVHLFLILFPPPPPPHLPSIPPSHSFSYPSSPSAPMSQDHLLLPSSIPSFLCLILSSPPTLFNTLAGTTIDSPPPSSPPSFPPFLSPPLSLSYESSGVDNDGEKDEQEEEYPVDDRLSDEASVEEDEDGCESDPCCEPARSDREPPPPLPTAVE